MFDDDDCRKFIKIHFNNSVLKAFDKLKPGAFKADLWRCCILYIYGGIYLDIKFCCVDDFKLISLTNDEYFVHDYGDAVYNAFIISKPKNPILLNCIKQIVQNVESNYYGTSSLGVTGPTMMINFFTPNEKRKLKRIYLKINNNIACIIYNNEKIILQSYKEYATEKKMFQINEHYDVLWKKRNIYN